MPTNNKNAELRLEIKGMKETQKKMEQVVRDMHGEPFLDGMRKATLLVQRDAKILSPVDSGRLRSSIVPEVRTEGKQVMGVVGSNVVYAPYMEVGTGIFAGNSRYFPPPAALELWASRHGTTGYAVALAIFKAGGLKPREFLRKALLQNHDRIVDLIGDAVGKIVDK